MPNFFICSAVGDSPPCVQSYSATLSVVRYWLESAPKTVCFEVSLRTRVATTKPTAMTIARAVATRRWAWVRSCARLSASIFSAPQVPQRVEHTVGGRVEQLAGDRAVGQ